MDVLCGLFSDVFLSEELGRYQGPLMVKKSFMAWGTTLSGIAYHLTLPDTVQGEWWDSLSN